MLWKISYVTATYDNFRFYTYFLKLLQITLKIETLIYGETDQLGSIAKTYDEWRNLMQAICYINFIPATITIMKDLNSYIKNTLL
jgi:hypothetical protein